ncbi:MAG: methylated-DNA--[protein]-cysteine S-methyltransferase [Luteitalea sp.]|nr:methylated-DNA--[protein]-cysteine S-methyltransferase [Luteitalea sp.]
MVHLFPDRPLGRAASPRRPFRSSTFSDNDVGHSQQLRPKPKARPEQSRGAAPVASARFRARVLRVVTSIPAGRVSTYGDVAGAAGRPRAARAVGNIMAGCSDPRVPCHRVVASGGQLGGYGGSISLKRELLRAEGVRVIGSRIRQFDDIRWDA